MSDTSATTRFDINSLRIATPCDQDWAAMRGDEQVRHCAQCRKNVYKVTLMTRQEVEDLVYATEGRCCLQLYRRQDGTVLTADCHGGAFDSPRRRALKRRLAGALALATLAAGCLTGAWAEDKEYASTDPDVEALRQKLLREAQAKVESADPIANPPPSDIQPQDAAMTRHTLQVLSIVPEPVDERVAALEQAKREADARAAAEEQARIEQVKHELQSCDVKKVKVGKNDTLESIARAHDSKVDWILVANPGLTEDNLGSFGRIKVPVSAVQVYPMVAGGIAPPPQLVQPAPAPTPQQAPAPNPPANPQ